MSQHRHYKKGKQAVQFSTNIVKLVYIQANALILQLEGIPGHPYN